MRDYCCVSVWYGVILAQVWVLTCGNHVSNLFIFPTNKMLFVLCKPHESGTCLSNTVYAFPSLSWRRHVGSSSDVTLMRVALSFRNGRHFIIHIFFLIINLLDQRFLTSVWYDFRLYCKFKIFKTLFWSPYSWTTGLLFLPDVSPSGKWGLREADRIWWIHDITNDIL